MTGCNHRPLKPHVCTYKNAIKCPTEPLSLPGAMGRNGQRAYPRDAQFKDQQLFFVQFLRSGARLLDIHTKRAVMFAQFSHDPMCRDDIGPEKI